MSLVTIKPLIEDAKKNKYGVGAFNMVSIENVRGAIKAAEELKSPIILMLAEVHMPNAPIEYIAPVMIEAAKNASVPVAVHFDHGVTLINIAKAIKLGFSSVMFDGSKYGFEKNKELSLEVSKMAHFMGISSEAELGHVGMADEGNKSVDANLTSVKEAIEFEKYTKVDALAVSIGNLHGQYIEKPCLRIDRLNEINEAVSVPLVLHGGTGISPQDFKKCIQNGISKVNIGTALQVSAAANVGKLYASGKTEYFKIMDAII